MKLPMNQAVAHRSLDRLADFQEGFVTPQGCPLPQQIACIAAIAKCAVSPNPIQCLLQTAPHCIECL